MLAAAKKREEEELKAEAEKKVYEISRTAGSILESHNVFSSDASLEDIKSAIADINQVIKANAELLAMDACTKLSVDKDEIKAIIERTADALKDEYLLNKRAAALEDAIEDDRYKQFGIRVYQAKREIFGWYGLKQF